MFHTLINVAYIIPNLYLFLRIWSLFINKGYRMKFTLVYLFVFLIYPLTSMISEDTATKFSELLIDFGNYILTFYLYLFLSVLLLDILLAVNYILKIVSPSVIKSKQFKRRVLSSIIIVSVFIVTGGIINFNTIRKSEYSITIPKRFASIDHLKIAFVADFHLKQNTNIHFVERFVKEIEQINPDIMLFGGDIVEGNRGNGDMTLMEDLLKTIKTKYGVYTVLGNHEFYAGQNDGTFMEKAGMTLLNDTSVIIANSVNIAGRIDSHFSSRKSVSQLMNSISDTLPLILIDHRPTELDSVSKTKTDVQLSGHTHNGQLFPINFITRSIYELSWGHKKIGNTDFFVTSGIRLWGPPVRTAGKSEIIVIDITFTSN